MTRSTAEQRFDELTADPVAELRQAVRHVTQHPVTDDTIVDMIGAVRAVEVRLAEYRKGLESEVTSGQVGEAYQVTESRLAKRSYNTNGILAAFFPVTGVNPAASLEVLMAADAVRLSWRWAQLQAAAQLYDVTLAVAKHEIEDGDPDALVGEVWSTSTRVIPKEAE